MGGAIAAAFAAEFPWLVDHKMVLLASAGSMPVGPLGLLHIFLLTK
jgi:hypothetical protein